MVIALMPDFVRDDREQLVVGRGKLHHVIGHHDDSPGQGERIGSRHSAEFDPVIVRVGFIGKKCIEPGVDFRDSRAWELRTLEDRAVE